MLEMTLLELCCDAKGVYNGRDGPGRWSGQREVEFKLAPAAAMAEGDESLDSVKFEVRLGVSMRRHHNAARGGGKLECKLKAVGLHYVVEDCQVRLLGVCFSLVLRFRSCAAATPRLTPPSPRRASAPSSAPMTPGGCWGGSSKRHAGRGRARGSCRRSPTTP